MAPTNTVVILLTGEIDLANATEVGDQICAAMSSDDARPVLVDCSGVTFIDSRGIAMLARVQRTYSAASRSLIWRGFNQHTLKVLRLLGVSDYLAIVDDL
jgi:anti-anti-sigma factor